MTTITWDHVVWTLWYAGYPVVFCFTIFPLWRGALWVFNRIRGDVEPWLEFSPWRSWLAWPTYFTLAVWSIGLAVLACVGYTYFSAYIGIARTG